MSKIRAREYRQYQRAVRGAVDWAIDELGLGDYVGAHVLHAMLKNDMSEEEMENPRFHRGYGCPLCPDLNDPNDLNDLNSFPAPLLREAITHELEVIFFDRSNEELWEAKEETREQELQKEREKSWKTIAQTGELHFLFVEVGWNSEFFLHGPLGRKERDQITKCLGLNPQNTIICTWSKRGRGRRTHREWREMRLSSFINEIKQCCKRGTKLRLYLHDLCRVPKEGVKLSAHPTGLRELYEDRHLSACLGEAKFGTKSFPWYLGRRALSEHLDSWLIECRKELWEHGRLTEDEAQRLLTGLRNRHKEAERRSLELLRKTVGEKETNALLKHGHLVVKSTNGRVYRITRKGEVIDMDTGEEVCVEVDSDEDSDEELPIYDEILAKYLVIRDHPEQIETLERDTRWGELVDKSIHDKICSHTGVSEDEVDERIEQKRAELGYQVTKLGAAFLVAKELGVNLGEREQPPNQVKIDAWLRGRRLGRA